MASYYRMMKSSRYNKQEEDAATLRLDMFRLIEIPAPESFVPITTTTSESSTPSAFAKKANSRNDIKKPEQPSQRNNCGNSNGSSRSKQSGKERDDANVLYWPCLLFQNQQQMMDVWDKYEDLYFGELLLNMDDDSDNLHLDEDYEDRLKRHVKNTIEFEYSMHLLQDSSAAAAAAASSSSNQNKIYNPARDAVVLLLGPDDCTPMMHNRRRRTYYYPRRTSSSSSSSNQDQPLLHPFAPSIPVLVQQQKQLQSQSSAHSTNQSPAVSSSGAVSKDGVEETVQQLQRLYAHSTTGEAQMTPLQQLTTQRRRRGEQQSLPSAPIALANTNKLASFSSGTGKMGAAVAEQKEPIPFYLLTPSEDEGDDDDDENDNGNNENSTVAVVPEAMVSTPTSFIREEKGQSKFASPGATLSLLSTPSPLHNVTPSSCAAKLVSSTDGAVETNPTRNSMPDDEDELLPLEDSPNDPIKELERTKRKLLEENDDDDYDEKISGGETDEEGKTDTKRTKTLDDPTPDRTRSSSSLPSNVCSYSDVKPYPMVSNNRSGGGLGSNQGINNNSSKAAKSRFSGFDDDDDDDDDDDEEEDDSLPLMDRALQRILKRDTSFQFHLLPHQFEAVRRIAGVPSDFPLHSSSRVVVHNDNTSSATLTQAVAGLYRKENATSTKGLCVADAMGLGKTVEAIAGAVLRDAISVKKGEKRLPILIVSPNDAVQQQWRDTLLRNGVSDRRIIWFKKGTTTEGFHSNNFILLTRYAAQSEIKSLFEYAEDEAEGGTGGPGGRTALKSQLFPHLSPYLLQKLRDEYMCAKGKTRITLKRANESKEDCITRLLKDVSCRWQPDKIVFRMMIIDEAHFLKNRLTYWTMACALSAMHSWRVIPLTGTPYNNGVGDLATLMTLIDPSEKSATTAWWERALGASQKTSSAIKESTEMWHQHYILRRGKKSIEHLLPAKIVEQEIVSMVLDQINVYTHYESRLADVMREFLEEMKAGETNFRLRNIFQILMAVMSSMRMSLLHPLLPASGREVTKRFSPSRSKLLSPRDCPERCVHCQQGMRPSIPVGGKNHLYEELSVEKQNAANVTSISPDKMEEGENYKDDTEEIFGNDHRPVYEVPKDICCAREPIRHYAHLDCIEDLKVEKSQTGRSVTCPRCLDFQSRIRGPPSLQKPMYWCQNTVDDFPDGFVGSPKLDAAVAWAKNVPPTDKMLILSFFKGSLDLMEAIFVHDLKWNCARFDGDVSTQQKNAELERFKLDPTCRVLLMTVQSGGVGLNITQSNHIAFLDRWFNPFVHQQAEDRCHRLGQKKDVTVRYFDCAATIDEAMRVINNAKEQNSQILLADGVELGTTGGSVSYTDISGLVSRLLALIQNHRRNFLRDPCNKDLPIPPVPVSEMESCVDRHRQGKAAKLSRNERNLEKSQDSQPCLPLSTELVPTGDSALSEPIFSTVPSDLPTSGKVAQAILSMSTEILKNLPQQTTLTIATPSEVSPSVFPDSPASAPTSEVTPSQVSSSALPESPTTKAEATSGELSAAALPEPHETLSNPKTVSLPSQVIT
ncbi:hypothetical protein ACA910_012302 [Epithemia clementina (nom. ined.)]